MSKTKVIRSRGKKDWAYNLVALLRKHFPGHTFSLERSHEGTKPLLYIDNTPVFQRWGCDAWVPVGLSQEEQTKAVEAELLKIVEKELDEREGRQAYKRAVTGIMTSIKKSEGIRHLLRTKIANSFCTEAKKKGALITRNKLEEIAYNAADVFLNEWIKQEGTPA